MLCFKLYYIILCYVMHVWQFIALCHIMARSMYDFTYCIHSGLALLQPAAMGRYSIHFYERIPSNY